jgi:gliding motility-associated-like protein
VTLCDFNKFKYMKTSTPKNLFYTILLSVFSIGITVSGYAQCGTEPITPTPWCENGFAKYTFTSPTAGASYYWYSYTPAPYTPADFDANGKLIRTGTVFYDSTTLASYTSIFRLTTATAPPGGLVLTYIKSVDYNDVNPSPATAPAFVSRPANTPFEMDFNVTSIPVRIKTVRVPVVLNTPGQTYKIQITFGTTAGPGSAVYNFSTVDAVNISGSNYYVDVPVNYTIAALGANKMVVNTSPAGAGAVVNGLLFSPSQAPTTTQGPITIPAASGSSPAAGSFANIFNWDYYTMCTPVQTPASTQTTVGCCIPPVSINTLTLTSSKQSIVSGSETTLLAANNAESATSNYFSWYLNGVVQPALSGVGRASNTVNQAGVWQVRELKAPPTPSATDINNPSCYAIADVDVQERKIFSTITTSPATSPACIGDTWTIAASGSTNYSWSTSGGTLSNTTGNTTTFTATAAGSTKVIVTGDIISNNLVVNGDFSSGAVGFTSLQIAPSPDLRNDDGGYAVAATAGTWGAQADWTFNATRPFVTGNPGNFLVINGEDGSTIPKPLVWGQKVNSVSPNQNYTFSFDLTSICYVVSSNTSGYTGAPGTAPFYDVEIEIYINGALVGAASTDFAINGGTEAVGKWKNHTYTWNSGTASSAAIEIRQKNLFPGRGYDFGLDNIKFGGLQTQTAEVAIGPIVDCSSITAVASPCTNDVQTTLTATVAGGLIFDHWELASGPNVSVSTSNPYTVNSLTPTTYVAVGYMPSGGNLLVNGDFNAGNIGFISGSPTYYDYVASGHGDNKYSVDNNITPYNSGWWINIPQAPGEPANSLRFFTDAKAQSKVIAWTFSATQNQKFAFSGYMANIHSQVTGDTVNSGIPAAVGVYINNTLVASYWSKNDRDWHLMSGQWTAPLAGTNTYTLEVRNLKLSSGGGNDFALDNFKLQALSNTAKKANVLTPDCNPCTKNLPTLGTPNTFCAATGIVHLTPNTSEPNGIFDWYDTAGPTGGTILGRSQGIDPDGDTLNVTTVPLDGSGNKIVYYSKAAVGRGLVYRKAEACTGMDARDAGSIQNETNQRYTSGNKTITITSAKVRANMFLQEANNCVLSGSIIFRVVAANAAGTAPNNAAVLGTLSTTYSRTRGAGDPADFLTDVTLTGNISIPANTNFFIVPYSATSSFSGTNCHHGILRLMWGNCDLTFPIVDNYNGTSLIRTGSNNSGGSEPNNRKGGFTFDIGFDVAAQPCPRVPVTLTPQCPCSKPTSVVITAPATTPASLCQGTAQTLSGTVTVGAAPLNTAFRYSWFKTTGTGSSTTVPLTTGSLSPNPTINTATAVPSNTTAITGTVAQSGTYVLRVEDGNTSNASCYTEASVVITINPLPTITGTLNVCRGLTTQLTGSATAATTGAWVSATPAVATVSNTGLVTGVTEGTSVITYTNSNGCQITTTVTVNALPTISGTLTVCRGLTTQLTGSVTAATTGAWASATPGVATVSNTGLVTGVTAGTSVITYTNSNSCQITATVTVNDLPTITGTLNVCRGLTTQLTGSATAATTGAWVSATPGVATVSNTGLVTGVTAGTSVITYTNSNGCQITATVTVNDLPTISGTLTVCRGLTTQLTGSVTAATTGAWASATPGVATVSNTGLVTGVTAGTSVITYTNSNSCQITATVTVNDLPTITGTLNVCRGLTTQLTGSATAATTGAWASATPGVATVSNTGLVTGVTAGTSVITYTNSNSCQITATVTVNALPAITGTLSVCAGSTTQFTGSATAATLNPWVSATAGVATVDGTGLVSGVAPGTSVITYTNSNGCQATTTVTVSPVPTVTGTLTVCIGSTTQLTGSGTPHVSTPWGSANTGVAAVSSTGLVSGVSGGTSVITYTNSGGCQATATVTVSTTAAAGVTITANPGTTICAGDAVTFTAVGSNGGTTPVPTYEWTSSETGATVISSTNTYSSSALVEGEVITVKFTSSLSCAVPAIATASETMTVNPNVTPTVTLTADQTAICPGDAVNYTATSTHGGTGTYTWSGTPTAAGTGSTYSTTDLAAGNSISVTLTTSLTCVTSPTAVSDPVSITIRPVPAVSVSISPLTQSICENNAASFTATASGTGLGAATTYEWFVTSASTPGPPAESQGAPSTTATSFSTSALTSTKNKVYVQVVSHEQCASPTAVSSAVAVVTVNAGIGAGTIGSDQEICNNGTPVTLTETGAPAGTAGTLTYVWQQTATPGDPLSWVTATTGSPSNGGKDFIPSGAFTSDIYYQRIVTDAGSPAPCNVATSNPIHIKVSPSVAAGSIVGNEGTCSGTATGIITSGGLPTGGQGTFTYVWEQTTTPGDPLSWTATSGTGTTYNAGSLTETTHFRRREVNSCGTVYSNVIEKTVSSPETVTALIDNTAGPVCITEPSVVFTATASTTGTGTLSYEWYLGPVSAGNKVGTNSSTYTYSPVRTADDGKEVRVVVSTSVGCNNGSATSAPYVLNIVTSVTPTVNITTNNNPQCAGLPVTFTAVSTGGGGLATYQWYVVPAGSPANAVGNPVGTGALTYRTTGLANGDRVYVSMTSSSGCLAVANPIKSNEIIMEIRPVPAPVIVEGDQTICSPNSFTFHGTVTAGNTYEWRLNTTRVVGTGVDFTATESGTYTLHESNGICNAPSSPVVLTVIESPVANAGLDVYMKQGDLGMLNGGGGSSGASYSWSPSGSLSSGIISNPVFTATQTTTYTLTVTESANGVSCPSVDDVTVFVVKPVVVPNVITVNGDGTNDDWEIENIDGYPNVIIEIYNRWGNLVWKTEGYPKNWDGTNFRNGEVLADGTYFYIINLQSQIYKEPLTGWVQIIK